MTDSIAELQRVADSLAELSTVPARAAAAAADSINGLLAEQFAGSHDPSGEAWAELLESTVKRKGGDTRILIRTGAAEAETRARPTAGAGIEITTKDYMSYHQTGTGHMVARKVLPEDGLPEEWEDAIDSAVEDAFQKVGRRA
jgi:hypothetical protein